MSRASANGRRGALSGPVVLRATTMTLSRLTSGITDTMAMAKIASPSSPHKAKTGATPT